MIVRGLGSGGNQMSFIARGALKSKRRFPGPVLEPSAFIEAEYRPSKKSLRGLNQAWMIKDFPGLRTSYDRLELALFFLRIMAEISQEGTNDSKEMFNLLGSALGEAEASPRLDLLKLFFQTKVLFLQGVLPASPGCRAILALPLKGHAGFQMAEKDLQALSAEMSHALDRYLLL